MEEFYIADLPGYYTRLQMGLSPLYYDGRNNPADIAPWIEYFLTVMERAFSTVTEVAQKTSESQADPRILNLDPREKILLKMLLAMQVITPMEIAKEFKVESRTIIKWAKKWLEKGLIEPASGTRRIRAYRIGAGYADLKADDLGY